LARGFSSAVFGKVTRFGDGGGGRGGGGGAGEVAIRGSIWSGDRGAVAAEILIG
jgi:hypothetical protein